MRIKETVGTAAGCFFVRETNIFLAKPGHEQMLRMEVKMQEKQKKIKSAENVDLEKFFKNHTVTEYEVDESKCTHFKIDGAEYILSPRYTIDEVYPSGACVMLRPAGDTEARELFSYSFWAEANNRYSSMYEWLVRQTTHHYPEAAANEYIPYVIYRMVTSLFLKDTSLAYWNFLHAIDLFANGIGSLVSQFRPIYEIRKGIHTSTERLKEKHPWIHLTSNEQILFESIVEHFIRHANTKQEDGTYVREPIRDMHDLITFIQNCKTDDLIEMVHSYPDMQLSPKDWPKHDLCEATWFDDVVFGLKRETASWIRNQNKQDIKLDNAVLRYRQSMLELFTERLGINIQGHNMRLHEKQTNLTHYEAGKRADGSGDKNGHTPSLEEIKSRITSSYASSYYGNPDIPFDVVYHNENEWSFSFTVPYKEEEYWVGQKYDAKVTYSRSSGYDNGIYDDVTVELIPKYIPLDEERICSVTHEVFENGFQIKAITKESSNEKTLPYDSLWTFMGDRQDQEYLDNHVIVVNFNTLKQLCDKARIE